MLAHEVPLGSAEPVLAIAAPAAGSELPGPVLHRRGAGGVGRRRGAITPVPVLRMSKKAVGRELDGATWDQMPEPIPA